jgi:hypothetical protein
MGRPANLNGAEAMGTVELAHLTRAPMTAALRCIEDGAGELCRIVV